MHTDHFRTRTALFPLVVFVLILASIPTVGAQDRDWTQVGDDLIGNAEQGAFGRAIDLSADGSRMVVGEPNHDVNGFNSGQVRIFDLVNDTWVQVGQDIDGDQSFDYLGGDVAISADGSRIIVGITQFGENDRPGIARAYDLVDGLWIQAGDDMVGENDNDEFGTSVAINADGSRIAVGAPGNKGALEQRGGHVRAYTYIDDNWMQAGADIEGHGRMGVSVAMSGDGLQLVTGASGYSLQGHTKGAIEVFILVDGAWLPYGYVVGEFEQDKLGLAIDVSHDGSTIITGTSFNDAGGVNAGQVRVYRGFWGQWIQVGPDINGVEGEWLGWSTSISDDGDRIAVGLRVPGDDAGLTRVYDFTGESWAQVGNDILDGQANGSFVEDVALSADGSRLAIGSTLDDDGRVGTYTLPSLPDPVFCGGVLATIVGTAGDDVLTGTDGPDVITGLQGNDVIFGLDGDDILCGGTGNDEIWGGQGFDIIYGAQGDDSIYSADGVDVASRSDTRGMRAFGGAGNDMIHGSNRWDRMQGGAGNDQLFGYEGQDWMRGGANADSIDGGAGADNMHGGNGNDSIMVTKGDTVRGGAGSRDTCNVRGVAAQLISCERLVR